MLLAVRISSYACTRSMNKFLILGKFYLFSFVNARAQMKGKTDQDVKLLSKMIVAPVEEREETIIHQATHAV